MSLPEFENMVSVIIPTYNRQEELSSAIESVLLQTYQNFEIVVCDDGSTDESHEAVTRFNDNRVRWIPGEHFGRPAIPRNNGIREARGDWVAFLDDDDVWLPSQLEASLRIIGNQAGDICAVCSNAFVCNTSTGSVNTMFPVDQGHKIISVLELIQSNCIIQSSVLVNKKTLAIVGFFPDKLKFRAYEDYAYWLRVASLGNFIYNSNPLIVYTDNPSVSIRSIKSNFYVKKTYVILNFLYWSYGFSKLTFVNNVALVIRVNYKKFVGIFRRKYYEFRAYIIKIVRLIH